MRNFLNNAKQIGALLLLLVLTAAVFVVLIVPLLVGLTAGLMVTAAVSGWHWADELLDYLESYWDEEQA